MDAAELDAALATVRSKYQPDGVTNLEGLLFPATYQVPEGDEVDEQKLVAADGDRRSTQVGDSHRAATRPPAEGEVGADRPYEVVIVASLIEREAKVPEDRPKIARVIYNRLAPGQTPRASTPRSSTPSAQGHRRLTAEPAEDRLALQPCARRRPAADADRLAGPGLARGGAATRPTATGSTTCWPTTDGSHYFTADYNDFLRARKEAQRRGLLGG